MDVAPEDLERIRDLYERGLYQQAYAVARNYGPLARWDGAAARLLAGRLAGNLGARRLACSLHLRTWRADRSNPEALYYATYAVLERRGPLSAWETLRPYGDFADAPPRVRSDLMSLRAEIAAALRDFDTAEHWLGRADELAADRTWTWVTRARVLELEDRYAEALEAVRRALEVRPWFRPAVQGAAHLLQLLDRDAEALALLRDAAGRLESGAVVAQLMSLETELGLFAEARGRAERLVDLYPLRERDLDQWVAARRCDAAYYCGDFARAAELAAGAKLPFYDRLAGRLAAPDPSARRVLLPVGFVRQHHMTCAPATLSAISRFWSMPAEHLAVAETICYDGTPAHSERRWAEENGWTAREFTVTWESATALLDRGVPFTLTTVEPGSAHLQAMIGYDARRRTFLVRDPYERHFGEFSEPETLQRYRPTGPRGMLLVPRGREGLLEGIDLPEAELYDGLTAVLGALAKHDRARAWAAYEALAARATAHRLTLQARRSLASYDADRVAQLSSVEELLRLYPDDANLQLSKLALLRDLARRDEREALLRKLAAESEAAPIFAQQYARELSADARRHPEAVALLRRAIHRSARDAESFHVLAGILWAGRRREEALELYRFAACLEDKNEAYAESYFVASRHLRQTAAALLFLRNRFRRFGKKSGWPARTLFWAYEQLERTTEAFQALDEALRLRPDDGDLLLFAAEAGARYGDFERAGRALREAEGKSHPAAWLRAAAPLAGTRGELKEALALWRKVVEAEPLAMDAQASVARLLAETEGRQEAFAYLRREVERFPHHGGIHQLRIEWLREGDPEEYEAAIRRLVELNPADAWSRRELAFHLGRQRRFAEAAEHADAACWLEPSAPWSHYARARVLAAAGRTGEAREACREAIRLSVDTEPAIHELVRSCGSAAERREALAFVHQELVRQVIFGDGLLTYREVARDTLDPEELMKTLREAVAARPDLWHAWAAIVRHATDMNRLDEALELARQATERFPLVPRLWIDLANVCQLRGDGEGELAALRQALRISPTWGVASRELAAALERAGDFKAARGVLEQAVLRSPLDAYNHGGLAQMHWKLGEKEAALARLEQVVRLDPGYDWAWGTLVEWSRELGRSDVPVRLARELTGRRAGEARSWLVLARTLGGPEALEERLAALRRAVELDPRGVDARDLRAALLADAGRFEEALEACGGLDPAPLELRGRAAWVEARRGRRELAVERMKAIVAEDPSYFWGWNQLADWYREGGAAAEYLEAAQWLVRLAPQSEAALGTLADARLRSGDRAAAKSLFRRSLEISPAYAYGGLSLFDLAFEDGDLDEAERVLEGLGKQVGGEYVGAREVQLACRRGDRARAERALERLCASRLDDRWPLDAAYEAMERAGAGERAAELFRRALGGAEANPLLAALWVRHAAAGRRWKRCEEFLRGLRGRPGPWGQGASAYVEALGDRRRRFRLRRFVRANRQALRADTLTWGSVGYAFKAVHDEKGCAEWLSDWPTRKEARPWMLLNLVGALRAVGRDGEAAGAGRAALFLPPDATRAKHRVWLALDAAVDGDPAEALEAVKEVDGPDLPDYYRFLASLARAAAESRTGDRREAFAKAREHLRRATRMLRAYAKDRALRRCYGRAVGRVARGRGGVAGAAWRAWKAVGTALSRTLGP
jgi:tetratricopeptide (TPR) repeat protein